MNERRWNAPPPRTPIPENETIQEARQRIYSDKKVRAHWDQWAYGTRCAKCGQVRTHVSHEPDPDHSIEGPEYYADFLDELHEFVEVPA